MYLMYAHFVSGKKVTFANFYRFGDDIRTVPEQSCLKSRAFENRGSSIYCINEEHHSKFAIHIYF